MKHERSEDHHHSPHKQQKIGRFFTKLTKEEAAQQAVTRLVRSADAREEWVEKQVVKNRKKQASRRTNNTRAQQEFRARKKFSEVQAGVRGPDGKTKASESHADCTLVC